MSLIIADTLSEKGHFNFNSKLLSWLIKNNFDIKGFFSESYSSEVKSELKTKTFNNKYISKKNMVLYILLQCILHFKIISYAKEDKGKVILLAYEIYSFSIMSYIYRLYGIDICVIEHNTVPTKEMKIKKIIYSLISNKVNHLCLEKYISKYIDSVFNKKTNYFNHPILIETKENLYDFSGINKEVGYFFMPSSTVKSITADSIIKVFIDNNKQQLIMKNIGSQNARNIIKKDYFDNYYLYLENAIGIILPQDFSYRVSGVFYESLAYANKVYMTRCIMSSKMKEKYPNKVVIFDNFSDVLDIPIDICEGIDVVNYNSQCEKQFMAAINDFY
ncbi:hypothetical protein [Providencia huaxiensis]|uniref:hypothetical protein n=1 Tax=Providencia huaxiensis TaxID=2027290 RepID=UPI0024AAE921|nr:hypothetical protein [Providencia rettgeri]ELR5155985.1 hypothetical protein [Providencia rettgeri]HEC8343281.1 hypothetical protein [Providencia rettgeri]